MKLTYGTYTFTITPPVETRSCETLFDERGLREGREETWTIKGYLKGDTGALDTASGLFDAAFQLDALDLKITDDTGATTYESMMASACYRGPRITSYSFENSGGKAEWATNRPFSITAKGIIYGNSGVLGVNKYKKETVWDYDQHSKITRTISGHCYSLPPYSALTICQTEGATGLAPALPAGYNRIHRVFEQNQDDTYCTFSYQDVQYWKAWPENVTGGGYTTSMSVSGNTITKTVSGSFTGIGAAQGISDLKTGLSPSEGMLTNESVSPDLFTGTISFSFSWQLPIKDGGFFEYEESLEYTETFREKIYHSLWDKIVIETGSLLPAKVIQSGKAVCYNRPVEVPRPILPLSLSNPPVVSTKKTQIANLPGEVMSDNDGVNPTSHLYTIGNRDLFLYSAEWKYEMMLVEDQNVTLDNPKLWDGGLNQEAL